MVSLCKVFRSYSPCFFVVFGHVQKRRCLHSLEDKDADFCIFVQIWIRISANSCKFGCKFHIKNIILPPFATFGIHPYNCADLDTDLCIVLQIWLRIYALSCQLECRFQHTHADGKWLFASADAAVNFRKYPHNCVACKN